jgi:hypothetical protein
MEVFGVDDGGPVRPTVQPAVLPALTGDAREGVADIRQAGFGRHFKGFGVRHRCAPDDTITTWSGADVRPAERAVETETSTMRWVLRSDQQGGSNGQVEYLG